jgi:hypothetical protein
VFETGGLQVTKNLKQVDVISGLPHLFTTTGHLSVSFAFCVRCGVSLLALEDCSNEMNAEKLRGEKSWVLLILFV